MKPSAPRTAVVLYLAAMVLIHAIVFWNVRKPIQKGYSDFAIYYCAASIVRQGLGHQLYDESVQFMVQQEFAPEVPIRPRCAALYPSPHRSFVLCSVQLLVLRPGVRALGCAQPSHAGCLAIPFAAISSAASKVFAAALASG